MEIIACPNCGSRRIYQGTMGEGVLTGYTTRNVCKDCGYQGMPIIFDSEKDYREFIKRKSKDKKSIGIKKKDIKNKKIKRKIKRPIGVNILVFILILEAIIWYSAQIHNPDQIAEIVARYFASDFKQLEAPKPPSC